MAKRRARTEGTLFKRKLATGRTVWVAQIDTGIGANGRRRRRTVYGKTQKEAREKLEDLKAKHRRNVDLEIGRQKLSDFLAAWIDDKHARGEIRASTERNYRDLIALHIKPYGIARKRLEKLSPVDVLSWHGDLREAEVGARTQRAAHAVLRHALKSAVVIRALDVSPAEAVRPPQYKAAERPTLDGPQVKKLLQALDGHPWEAFVKLGLLHGLRLGEIAALRWGDVDLRSRTLRIEHTLTEDRRGGRSLQPPKTERSKREVPLSQNATRALRRHRARLKAIPHPGAFVFGGGQPIRRSNWHRRVWRPLLKAAGLAELGLHFHDTRHTAASMLVANGVDVVTVAGLLGHSSASVTLRVYSHSLPSKTKGTADRVDELFGA